MEHVATLRDTMMTNQMSGTPMYIAFLDFSKAYDTIIRPELWKALHHYHVPDALIQLLNSYYTQNESYVRLGKLWLQDAIDVNDGVKQGCPISPLLFDIVLDDVIVSVNQRCMDLCAMYKDKSASGAQTTISSA